MTTCPSCGQEVPAGRFCVRCGAGLSASGAARGFAAAPREHRWRPAIVSSLFPHLPQADMKHYRIAMGVGTLIVLGLGLAGWFGLALAGAAVLVPLLAALYLHDVNIYEEKPLLVILFTLAWGAAAGVLVALLGHALTPSGIDQLASGHRASALVTVVLLPALELVLAVAGPAIVLLPNRRFNDVLDGVTFGAATAAALSATEVIVNGYRLLEHGLAPGGHVLPWIWRLLTIRLALPILAMAATGAACGALWLRYRGPARDRGALGPLGHPVVAFGLRASLLMAAAAGQRWLPVGLWFVTLLILDAIALIWLRMMLQLGLREESAEVEIGSDVHCPNCGAQTPRHTFCAECGVALRALPKSDRVPQQLPQPERPSQPEEPARPAPQPLPHPAPTRLLTRSRVIGFVSFLGLLVVAAGIIGVIAPPRPVARCPASRPCGTPPPAAPPLRTETAWRSPALGFGLEYSAQQWSVSHQGPAGIELQSSVAPVDLVIRGVSGATPSTLLSSEIANLRGNVLGLAVDPAGADAILGPAVGYRFGAGGSYVGALDSPQGVQDQALFTVTAASAGGLGIVVTTVTTEARPATRHAIYGLVDSVVNTVTWPGQT